MKKMMMGFGGLMVAVALVTVMPACGASDSEATGSEKAGASEKAGVAKGSETASAEKAIKDLAAAVGSGQLDAIVGMLPASYAKDIGTLINTFAARMDADLWDKGRTLASSLLGVVATKADLFTDMAKEQGGGAVNVESKELQEAAKALSALLKSDALSLNSMKKTDAKAFAKALSASVAPLAKSNASTLFDGIDPKNLKIASSELKADGTVELTVDGAPASTTLKLVEGKWVPEDMADEWKEMIEGALEGINEIDFASDEGKQSKMMALMVMGMIEPVIKELEAAKTKEDIESIVGGMMGNFF